jgi:hypothetical protein
MSVLRVGGIDPVRLGFALLAAFVILVIASVSYVSHLENPTQRYATYEEARRAGAMAEGKWIPAFLPKSSSSIVETHDLDTNALEIRFDYMPGDLGTLRQECAEDAPLQFSCRGWGLPVRVLLDPTGKGTASSTGD